MPCLASPQYPWSEWWRRRSKVRMTFRAKVAALMGNTSDWNTPEWSFNMLSWCFNWESLVLLQAVDRHQLWVTEDFLWQKIIVFQNKGHQKKTLFAHSNYDWKKCPSSGIELIITWLSTRRTEKKNINKDIRDTWLNNLSRESAFMCN